MITIDALLKTPELANLKILAGRDGLSREISAISIMDAPDSYKWLKGGEFILTTGFMFGGDDWQVEHFLEILLEAGCSAVGIKKGRFLGALPDNVLSAANRAKFPIIEIPYNFGWSDIISVYYKILYSPGGEGSDNAVSPADANAGQSEPSDDSEAFYGSFLQKLHGKGINARDIREFESRRATEKMLFYGILLVDGSERSETLEKIREIIQSPQLTRWFVTGMRTADNEDRQVTVALLEASHIANEITEKWQFLLREELEYCMRETGDGSVSMGRLYPTAGGIATSYKEATEARASGKALWGDGHCFFHPMLSIYNKLSNTDLSDVDMDYIRVLEQCSERLTFDGIESLEAFIECGGFKKAAAKLYVHENTLRYRVQKISDLLHVDMSDGATVNMLITQLKLWRLLRHKM